MLSSLSELKQKEVIDIESGEKLGYIDDVEIDTETSAAMALVIYGRPRIFGLFGRDDDLIVKCSEIVVIGKETILIKAENPQETTKSRKFFMESLYK